MKNLSKRRVSNQDQVSLFDAGTDAIPEQLAVDPEELAVLKTKDPEALRMIMMIKGAFGQDARVVQ